MAHRPRITMVIFITAPFNPFAAAGTARHVIRRRAPRFQLCRVGQGSWRNGGFDSAVQPARGRFFSNLCILDYHLDSKSSMQVDIRSRPPPPSIFGVLPPIY